MKQLKFSFDTCLRFSAPVVRHTFTLRCVPPQTLTQRLVSCRCSLSPDTALWKGVDGFGNELLCGSIHGPHSEFSYHVSGVAQVDLSLRRPEPPHPAYRYPGALTQPDGALGAFYAALPLAGLSPAGKAERICRAVHGAFAYAPGVTHTGTTAAEAFALKRGVCQDYAHVMLVLCRMAGLAARYVSGLPAGEGSTHAWVEVCLPDGWAGYDPTRLCPVGETYLRLAVGRDYADCPIERGVLFGNGSQSQSVLMCVQEIGR